MRNGPYIKETKREFIREKRRNIKEARKAFGKLRSGCAITAVFGSPDFRDAVYEMEAALQKMDNITKLLR